MVIAKFQRRPVLFGNLVDAYRTTLFRKEAR